MAELPPPFKALRFDRMQCRQDLAELEQLLANRPSLNERTDILPFFKRHPHLALFLASYDPNIRTYNCLAFELEMFGQFSADVVVGDWARHSFCFIEFEDGTPDSIFRATQRHTTDWAPRFEHGFSQIVDWFWLLRNLERTEPFERQFGARAINAMGILVIGRDSGISAGDRLRLDWRRDHVVVDSKKIYCCTFDELLRDLREKLYAWAASPPE